MAQEDLSQADLKNLEEALRTRICSVCVDRSLEGICHLEVERQCALFDSFPQIVQAVSNVRSDLIEDYVAAIRKTICAGCAHQHADGFCRVRGEVRCVLDRYLLLIVQTIEEIQGLTLKPGGGLHQDAEMGTYQQIEFRRGTSSVVRKQREA
jgi:hypothetical protein